MSNTLRNLLTKRAEPSPAREPGQDPAIEIDEVVDVREGTPHQPSHARLSRPPAGGHQAGYALSLAGWIFDQASSIVAVEALDDRGPLKRLDVDVQRDDIAAKFPEEPHAKTSGFTGVVGAVDLPARFDLSVQAIDESGDRYAVWRIRGRRAPLLAGAAQQPRMRPLVLNGLGRSGTTWLMWLLAHHPEIVVYRPFGREPRIAGYWIEVLRNLGEPRSHIGALAPRLGGPEWWLGEADPGPLPAGEEGFEHAVSAEMLQELAAFGRRRTEAAYSALARDKGKKDAKWFAEKSFGYRGAGTAPRRLYDEIYPDSRELLLVRDFRDVVSSMAAYDAKRGFVAFGRDSASDEREFLSGLNGAALHLLERHRARGDASSLVRYEDLVTDPRRALAPVFEHLGVDATPERTAGIVAEASEETASMQAHRTAPDSGGSIGRWRRDLSAEQKGLVSEVLAEALAAYGYETG